MIKSITAGEGSYNGTKLAPCPLCKDRVIINQIKHLAPSNKIEWEIHCEACNLTVESDRIYNKSMKDFRQETAEELVNRWNNALGELIG